MKTAEEYLALAEHYRAAKLGTTNATARHQLETLERSYFVLAESTELLGRSINLQQSLPNETHRPLKGQAFEHDPSSDR